MTLFSGILWMVACLLIEAFFSGSEIALVNADRLRLQREAAGGNVGAQRALTLLGDEAAMLGTCLIGTNLAVVSGSALCTTLMLAQGISEGWVVGLAYVPFALVFGEALPKTVMQFHADRAAVMVSGPLLVARRVFAPALGVVRLWGRMLSKFTGTSSSSGYLTRQELLDLLEDNEPGAIAPEERRLIRGVLELRTTTVYDAMTPLVQVVGVHEEATVGFAIDIAARTQHSRLPVYRGRIDNVVGMVHQVDLLFLSDDREPMAPHVRAIRFVPDQKSAKALFQEMRTEGDHFAVVVDEYGGSVGIVTLEDLLEQLVGDIEDEHDTPDARIVVSPDGTWRVPAQTPIETVEQALGIDLPTEGPYETLAGLVLFRLGRIPARGEALEVDGHTIAVEQANERAIIALSVRPKPASNDGNAGGPPAV